MEHQEQENALQKVVKIFKRTVRTVKAIPYLFLFVYCIYLVVACTRSKILMSILDFIYGTSVGLSLFILLLSKELGLCIWHKVACLIPITSLIVSIIDAFIFYFSYEEIVFINMATLIFVICYLIWSFFHFFVDGQ